jgi:hypothetical protein
MDRNKNMSSSRGKKNGFSGSVGKPPIDDENDQNTNQSSSNDGRSKDVLSSRGGMTQNSKSGGSQNTTKSKTDYITDGEGQKTSNVKTQNTNIWEDFDDKSGTSSSAVENNADKRTNKQQLTDNRGSGGKTQQLTDNRGSGGKTQQLTDNSLRDFGDEPPVNTDRTLKGQKGGDECVYTDEQIRQIKQDLAKAEKDLITINDKVKLKGDECLTIQKEAKEKSNNRLNVSQKCRNEFKNVDSAKKTLKNIPKGTIKYSRQLDYVSELQTFANSCKRKNTEKTEYTRMFITQIYDSNEYEGDISVFDKDWNKDDELIHDCKD